MRSAPAPHRATLRSLASVAGCARLGLLLLALPAVLAGAVASLALLAVAFPFVALGAGGHRPPLRFHGLGRLARRLPPGWSALPTQRRAG
jgi:hypothetical protein